MSADELSEIVGFRVTKAEKALMQKVAKRDKRRLSDWIRVQLIKALTVSR
jgi:hypothetical protein